MSKIAAKIAVNMDKEGDHFMAKEYCVFLWKSQTM